MVGVIPVSLQPEPADFDRKVRQPGLAWLAAQGIPSTGPAPQKPQLRAFWSASNKALWDAYKGTCAYLAIYFDWDTGASSTDHFIPKSVDVGQAYEWANYRLSCLGANRNKNKFGDVFDPIGMPPDAFELNLLSGEIKPDRTLAARHGPAAVELAEKTISRLKLDSPDLNSMRSRHFRQYLRKKDADTLRDLSPFVYHEALRQGLL